MKKCLLLFFLTILSTSIFAKVEIKILEPLRYEYFNTRMLQAEEIAGYGILEITAKKEDFGKKLVFSFPKSGLMTNMKKWIKVQEYGMELPNKELIITQETEHVKFYALLNKRDIDNGEDAKIIEGEYIGYVPIIVSQYSQLPGQVEQIETPQTGGEQK
ncbi:hypothetical protein [uncultured Fusobacterium sp.]|uniref:hypothetical protein n=1 Tax=uncultured Fusobacterium sp. TaxID=159267 RepID=UPI0025DE8265|nr:hypothetical protein [uncultured Fusobacterium sp.]